MIAPLSVFRTEHADKGKAAAKKITVIIADDQTLFREGIKDLLENEKNIQVIAALVKSISAPQGGA